MSRGDRHWKNLCRWDWKVKAIQKYGGKCCRCGFADYRALQFDHINGAPGIRNHRNKDYEDIAKGRIKDLQLLCANCHCVKTIESCENNREEFNTFLLKVMQEKQNGTQPQREVVSSFISDASLVRVSRSPSIW